MTVRGSNIERGIDLAQGVYYVAVGLWPVLDMASFELVTGPKTDDWLVKMVGLLAAAIGAALLVGSRSHPRDPALVVLAGSSAIAFAAMDVIYVTAGQIRPIYLADVPIEAVFAATSLAEGWKRRRS